MENVQTKNVAEVNKFLNSYAEVETIELQRKIQFNLIMLIVCLCALSSLSTYFIIKSQPTITQSQNVYINKFPEKQKVNINTATIEELKTLPSVDFKKANIIVNNRPYKNIHDITKLRGIGDESMSRLETLISCEEVRK